MIADDGRIGRRHAGPLRRRRRYRTSVVNQREAEVILRGAQVASLRFTVATKLKSMLAVSPSSSRIGHQPSPEAGCIDRGVPNRGRGRGNEGGADGGGISPSRARSGCRTKFVQLVSRTLVIGGTRGRGLRGPDVGGPPSLVPQVRRSHERVPPPIPLPCYGMLGGCNRSCSHSSTHAARR